MAMWKTKMNINKDELAYVTIEIKNGNASFIGSSQNQGGQMQDSIKPRNKYEKALIAMWNRWHLNNMNPNCKHQKALWDLNKKIEIIHYKQDLEQRFYNRKKHIKELVNKMLRDGRPVQLKPLSRELYFLPYSLTNISIEVISPYFKQYYKEDHRETKGIGWLYEKDHPEGIMCKPCPVCGYKYGTAWLKEELPPKFEVAIEYLVNKIDEMRKEENK